MRGMVLVATTHIKDEELFLKYATPPPDGSYRFLIPWVMASGSVCGLELCRVRAGIAPHWHSHLALKLSRDRAIVTS
jgi:hypothetical protein